jgi:hypothetical protein
MDVATLLVGPTPGVGAITSMAIPASKDNIDVVSTYYAGKSILKQDDQTRRPDSFIIYVTAFSFSISVDQTQFFNRSHYVIIFNVYTDLFYSQSDYNSRFLTKKCNDCPKATYLLPTHCKKSVVFPYKKRCLAQRSPMGDWLGGLDMCVAGHRSGDAIILLWKKGAKAHDPPQNGQQSNPLESS